MSYLSELDSSGFEQRNTEDLLNQREQIDAGPGFFAGALKGPATGLMRGFANLNDLLLTASDLVVPMSDEERGQQEEMRRSAADFWTPDARTVGTAGRVLGGAAEGLAPLAVPFLGPALTVGSNTLAAGKRAVDAGVDAKTAGELAAVEGAATYVGLKLPILGKTLAQRLATGAAGNLALGAVSTEAEHALLNSRGYEELAKNYDPLDGEARATDLIAGLVFGGLHHLMLPSERAAAATLNNAKHFQKDTAPGVPVDPAASNAHQGAMDDATGQLLRGEPVNVRESVTRATFEPRTDAGNPVPEELQALDRAQKELSDKSAAQEQAGGYDVAEGELTDEQLAAFQGLRSDVPANQNMGGSGAGVSERPVVQDAGGARGEPLRVYRGAARELAAEDFKPEALGFASEKPAAGLGVFFSKSKAQAAQHGTVTEHLLDIRNPKVYKAEDVPGFGSKEEATAFSRQLEAEGHDGIVIDASEVGGPVNYVAFKHQQVLPAAAAKAMGAKPKAPSARKSPAAASDAEKATADDPVTAAVREHLVDQDVAIPTGEIDVDGNAVIRSAREMMAEADAEIAGAQETGKGIAAAVSCFLTRGG